MFGKRREIQYVFGYGSLVDAEDTRKSLSKSRLDYLYCYLNGFKRDWRAAYNNFKRRKDYTLCFLNITKYPGSRVFGILIKVDDRDLKILDRREVAYDRIDVTSHFGSEIRGLNKKVWTYTANRVSREIYKEGLKKKNLIIPKYYAEMVLRAYYSLGKNKLIEFLNDTEDEGIRVVSTKLWWD